MIKRYSHEHFFSPRIYVNSCLFGTSGVQVATYCSTSSSQPQPDYQRVAQQWGRGLTGGALPNLILVLLTRVAHAIMLM